ncbi:GNAT family N-acetyltransferase [Paenibacillus tritici]|jgi:[ribosomal protein S5]-alanine N-acetyltransferase|uniref:GNAT family N-acetyltransferase n=1 Tax=Paenibacillus tritici TaxID=1873425 RepID=A0ABX2DQI8_9BACL|nr:GNAT family N-acetyltransferase [Paenibacillus tritici]NQX46933.1 GNAT family N-acetyltransferase [Paenibacillus tritici]QUL55210.1 GNAT family N-acetyltransferase [Paenibacillus tritici]
MQEIITDRLIIRNFRETDAPGMLEYLANPRVNCFLSERISTLDEAVATANTKSQDDSHLAVCLKDTGSIIGELFCMKEEPDTYSVGWHLNPKYEGSGYASESARALLQYLFITQEARRIYAYVEDDNSKSQKLCEKLGMRREGCFMEFISFTTNADGTPKYENTQQFAILKREWLQQ